MLGYSLWRARPVAGPQSAGLLTSTPVQIPNVPANAPLGIKNNNPGNLRPSIPPFNGQAGSNNGYAVFDSPVNGVRAIFKIIQNYQRLYGLATISDFGNRYAPPSENNTTAWISNVSLFSGIGKDQSVNVSDPTTMYKIVKGIIGAECGSNWANYYATSVFDQAWAAL